MAIHLAHRLGELLGARLEALERFGDGLALLLLFQQLRVVLLLNDFFHKSFAALELEDPALHLFHLRCDLLSET